MTYPSASAKSAAILNEGPREKRLWKLKRGQAREEESEEAIMPRMNLRIPLSRADHNQFYHKKNAEVHSYQIKDDEVI